MIKALTGMSAAEFGEAGDTGDPDALAALICILHKRQGITIALDDIDIDFSDFDITPTSEELAADTAAKRNDDLGKKSPKQ